MRECQHSWKEIEAKGNGVVECSGCGQRWRGGGAEFVWKRAKDAIRELERRLQNVTEALDRRLDLLCCDFCGAYFPRGGSKYGVNVSGTYVCYACAPGWFENVANRLDSDRERHYARMALARWLTQYCYYNPHTAKLYRALEAEVTGILKEAGKLTYAVN